MPRRSSLHLELERAPTGTPSRDRAPRRRLRLRVRGSRSNAGESFLVHNLSATGLLIESATDLPVGTQFALDLPEFGTAMATVRWNSGHLFGCSFEQPLPPAAMAAAQLKNPPAGAEAIGDSIADEAEAGEAGLPARLRALRETRGLSLEDVAQRVEVSRQTVWYWETGRSAPTPRNLRRLAGALDATVEELCSGSASAPGGASLATVKQWVARELGISPEAVEIHIRL